MSLAQQSQTWFPTHVQVTVLQAKALRSKGKAGTNDAYAIIQLGKEKYSTTVAEKSQAPVWKEEASFEVPLLHKNNQERCTVHIIVMHRALVGMDKFLGQLDLNLWDLHQTKNRRKVQWYPLRSKPGKKEKERGQIEVEVEFKRNNMTASMFDLSMKEKSRSPFGKLKDKIKGKRSDGLPDTASAIVPSMNEYGDESDDEMPWRSVHSPSVKMSDGRRCPECGSGDIVEDSHYSQEQLVCADCGVVVTEGRLTSTQAEESYQQAVRFTESTGQNESISRTKLRGIVRVRNLCRVLRLPDTFADTAVSYYERAFYLPGFHAARQEKKEAVMGCCVYITCRQHRWPLTIGTISTILYSKYEILSSVFTELVQALKLDVPSMSLQDLAKSHCSSFRLFQNCPSVPEDYVENLEKVLERTTRILELASETWLITGRHPIPIVTAAAYLSWQSLKPVQRLSCTFSKFCKWSDTELPPPALKRLKELKENCLKLASELPWLRMMTVNEKKVVYHLDDILKHQGYLLRKALEAAEMLTSESEEPDSDQERPNALFLPPCMANPKKRPHSLAFSNELQNITGDEDILDSEIEQYLRTPAEVACLLKVQAQLDADK